MLQETCIFAKYQLRNKIFTRTYLTLKQLLLGKKKLGNHIINQ